MGYRSLVKQFSVMLTEGSAELLKTLISWGKKLEDERGALVENHEALRQEFAGVCKAQGIDLRPCIKMTSVLSYLKYDVIIPCMPTNKEKNLYRVSVQECWGKNYAISIVACILSQLLKDSDQAVSIECEDKEYDSGECYRYEVTSEGVTLYKGTPEIVWRPQPQKDTYCQWQI